MKINDTFTDCQTASILASNLSSSDQKLQQTRSSWWQRVMLGAILLLSAFLNFIHLDQIGYGNTYYATGVKSMLLNWHNFFFVAFDPNGFVTIDKPPLGFWIQAASAKLFGFSGLSLLLPEALAGILSVAVLYRLVTRSFGPSAGLLAALALAIAPISVVTNRNNTIDSLLVLTILLATWTVSRATESGHLRWLLISALLVGVGFNIKMLQAFLILPAFGLLYLLSAPIRWRTRFLHLALAVVVLLPIAFVWVAIVDLTPASQRPYVGSTNTNSELDLAIGYNGLQRLLGHSINILPQKQLSTTSTFLLSTTSLYTISMVQAPPTLPVTVHPNTPGPLRLFNFQFGGQVGWLLPLALLSMLALAWQPGLRLPFDKKRQALVLWGIWLLTMGAFFSMAQFFNMYYTVMLVPSICALFGIGMVVMWQDYRRPGWRGWLLPLALLTTALVQGKILSEYPTWSAWLTPLMMWPGFLAAFILTALRFLAYLTRHKKETRLPSDNLQERHPLFQTPILRLLKGALLMGACALLLAPLLWGGFSVLQRGYALQTSAGPGPNDSLDLRAILQETHPSAPLTLSNLDRYLQLHQGNARFLAATLTTGPATSIILDTGQAVMALGGFKGGDPILTLQQLTHLITQGTVRFFVFPITQKNNPIVTWVNKHCTTVPTRAILAMSTQHGTGIGTGMRLFDCTR